jgi:hypothetical protein
MSLDQITVHEEKDFSQLTPEELVGTWRENHQTFLRYLKETPIPYFGIHGTSEENLNNILKSKNGSLNLVTFYDKTRSEKRLFQLYHGCLYASSYAFNTTRSRDSPGGILVFNLNGLGDKNVTHKWEKLLPGGSFGELDFDTKRESRYFKIVDDEENLLWRACHPFSDRLEDDKDMKTKFGFSEHFRGIIGYDEFKRYISKLEFGYFEWYARGYLRTRHHAQHVLKRALELVR